MRKKKTFDLTILFYVILFFIISIITLYGTLNYINSNNLILRQTIYYLVGVFIIFIILKIDSKKILKYSLHIYLINILLLIIVLLFGNEINGTKAWIEIPFFGSFQPSEFMKIGLILFLATTIKKEKDKKTNDFVLIFKCFIIFLIPTILTFLEPDTGAVFIYFIITVTMLFMSGIKLRWFIIALFFLLFLIGGLAYLYFFNQNTFIEIFGSNFFYRFDRIIDWNNSSGMQLENSIIGIASSNIFGHGFDNIPIYFPEPQTDFIFSSFVCCFGLIGALFLFLLILIFDFKIIGYAKNTKNEINKLIIFGLLSSIIYQQIQNISMTIGLLPITGITLPFISYGGSSLLSYMILIGIMINLNKKNS